MENKKAKAIVKEMWSNAPKTVKKYARREGAIIVSMAAGLLVAGMDECGKMAVQDMAHELNYTWDPFDGFCA
ncbi:MAG: hypothetical protein J6M41_08695 [Prevotella sp.]|nr:hypothetical protein [Prevotella sp.]